MYNAMQIQLDILELTLHLSLKIVIKAIFLINEVSANQASTEMVTEGKIHHRFSAVWSK